LKKIASEWASFGPALPNGSLKKGFPTEKIPHSILLWEKTGMEHVSQGDGFGIKGCQIKE